MRILVCGGRDFTDQAYVDKVLDMYLTYYGDFECVIVGGAKGVDTFAQQWAESHKIPVKVFPAKWESFGKKAGYIRNLQMVTEGGPDAVISFPGGKGTANMTKIAEEHGIWVLRPQ